jgi:hypothetical protein
LNGAIVLVSSHCSSLIFKWARLHQNFDSE